jgi:hypothetical protein
VVPSGAAVQFWCHDEDKRLIRELYAWLAGQGHRPSDSAIIREALRIAKPRAALLEAYPEARSRPAMSVTSVNVPSPLLRNRIFWPRQVINTSSKPSL